MGFKPIPSDPCVYVGPEGEPRFYIAVYVDDIILAGESELKLLGTSFRIKDMGELSN